MAWKAPAVATTSLFAAGALAAWPQLAVAPAAPAIYHKPRQALSPSTAPGPNTIETSSFGWSASNWSGYAVTGSTYNDITGNWIVPAVSPSKKNTYSSSWIGRGNGEKYTVVKSRGELMIYEKCF